MYYLLFYEGSADYEKRRGPFRSRHLDYARKARARGLLVLAGAYADPVDGALLVFKTPSREEVESFARNDPYVENGVVERWHLREWNVVVGPEPS